MKELSTEEKAKAYDEALKVLRKYDGANIILSQSLKEEMFPELKENRDEKIKKSINRLIRYYHDVNFPTPEGFSRKDLLDWVEKQGEQKPVISDNALRDGIAHFGITQYQIDNWLKKYVDVEKKGEQGDMKTCAEYYNQDNEWKMPELSEFQDKLADILMHREYDGPDETEDDIARGRLEYELAAIRLSEELLPFAIEQKPAEWSEEDEDILNTIINHFKIDIECTDEDDTVRWLKSLKDRYTWRPSEMQMTALRRMKNAVGREGEIYEPLNSLYEDLKKLKD